MTPGRIRAFKGSRPGIAYDMLELFVTLAVFAVLYIIFGSIVSYFQTWQQQDYGSGVFDPNILGFVNQYWIWLPFGMLLISGAWGFMRAIKRREMGS
jgi:hypothetical protein